MLRDEEFMETIMKTLPEADALTTSTSAPGAQELPRVFHPNVLLVQWEIHMRSQQWAAASNTALALITAMPGEPIGWIYRSFALQQLGLVREALENLLTAARRFPSDWRIAFNLASYASQLGDRAGAWNWLDRATELGDAETVKALALEIPSFQPVGHN
jgi:tetratricopeptide (TPR) repeat protein